MKRFLRQLFRTGLPFLLAFAMTVGAMAAFPDMASHWAAESVDYWTERGVLSGYPDGNFHPDENISRAEVASVVARILQLTGENGRSFSDVPESHWAYRDIEACAANDVVNGFDGFFWPGKSISRQEAMAILYRVSRYAHDNPNAAVEAMPDGDDVAQWAKESVGTLLGEGVVTGLPDGTIGPNREITRGEFVTLLHRIDQAQMWDTFSLPPVSLAWNGENGRVLSQRIGGTDWLFLPGAADLKSLWLDCGVQEDDITVSFQGNLDEAAELPLDLSTLSSPEADGSYLLKVTFARGEETRSRVFHLRKGSLPAVFLTSEDGDGRAYVDAVKGNSVKGSMVMVETDGTVRFDDTLSQIKSRGNSTFFYPKKPYQIKLDKKADLLGNGEKVKTWVLLANYADATLFRDKLCKDLALDMELPGTPECRWIDLFFDGEYRGCYLLTEKIQIASTGLDITDLEGMYEDTNPDYGDEVSLAQAFNRFGAPIQYVEGLTDPEDIENGYLVEMNYDHGDENSWFITRRGWAFNVKSPENLTQRAMTYISEYYQEFEDAVYGVDELGNYNGINAETGKSFTEYCDLDSLASMYLLYYFSNNQDAYVQSTYFYMEDGMLHAGPIWDSDQTFGIGWVESREPDSELMWSYLVEALVQLPDFREKVTEIYETSFRQAALDYASGKVPEYGDLLSPSEAMNHLVWPVYYRVSGLGTAYPADIHYSEILTQTAQWMTDRIAFMDRVFAAWTPQPEPETPELPENPEPDPGQDVPPESETDPPISPEPEPPADTETDGSGSSAPGGTDTPEERTQDTETVSAR